MLRKDYYTYFSKNGITIRFKRNESNRFWKPVGLFRNHIEVFYKDKWINCSIYPAKYSSNNKPALLITIPRFYLSEPENAEIIIPISKFNAYYLGYLEGTYEINKVLFEFSKGIYKKRLGILVLLLLALFILICHISNEEFISQTLNSIESNIIFKLVSISTLFFGVYALFFPVKPLFNSKKHQIEEKNRIDALIKERQEKNERDKFLEDNNTFL